jgi:hypothetical protein
MNYQYPILQRYTASRARATRQACRAKVDTFTCTPQTTGGLTLTCALIRFEATSTVNIPILWRMCSLLAKGVPPAQWVPRMVCLETLAVEPTSTCLFPTSVSHFAAVCPIIREGYHCSIINWISIWSEPVFHRSVVCESGTNTLSCGSKYIEILQANYGRTEFHPCPHPLRGDLACRSSNSKSIVSNTCSNTHVCYISAKNSVFGDPCGGTYKYLDVVYRCVWL